MTEVETQPDYGDPADWDEWPDGYGAVIARYLEDEGWRVEAFDDTTVNVIASNGTDTGVWFARARCCRASRPDPAGRPRLAVGSGGRRADSRPRPRHRYGPAMPGHV